MQNPLLFVLVSPPLGTGSTFKYQLETFGNHKTGINQAGWGGDLCFMDTEGNVRFLTHEAGYGVVSGEIQGENAIAVRQPTVHWSGNKAVFSMVVGGPKAAYDQSYRDNRWQLYEVTNLDEVVAGMPAKIEKIANQPNYNNISPVYGTDDQIIYTSDAPLFGLEHTYPQLDEYESDEVNSGIWKLNPSTGEVTHLTHSPSGDFDLFIASDGRVISTRWEHLKRDQQADAHRAGGTPWQPVNYESEADGAVVINGPGTKDGKPYADADGTPYEVFPEARVEEDPTRDPNEPLHDFNEFLPWEISENGERHQTMNHVGRHEFGGVFQHGSKIDDPNLIYTLGNFSANEYRETIGSDAGIFQIKEDPRPGKEGTFYGTWSREFSRMASGRIFEFALPIGANPQEMEIVDWTHPDIDNTTNDKGHFRNPIMLLDGTMIVSYTSQSAPFTQDTKYHFQLAKMEKVNSSNDDTEHTASQALTGNGFEREILYWGDNTEPISYTVNMNEVDVVEVVSRTRPSTRPEYAIEEIEKQVLEEEGVDEQALRDWLIENNMALIVIRNATERDQGENQQPFNLRVPGGVETIPTDGKVYDISHFQIFQADMIRSYGFRNFNGRRSLATPIHNTPQSPAVKESNILDGNGPESSVKIASDGSIAAFVPATRALSWQTVSPEGEPIVRERQWLTFAPGEIRTCEGCHGINDKTHAGNFAPQNKPDALRELLAKWNGGNVVGIENNNLEANGIFLHQNQPNPVLVNTAITFEIPERMEVHLEIYNGLGAKVKTLWKGLKNAGKHEIIWNKMNDNLERAQFGLYYCVLSTKLGTTSVKMLVADN